MKPRGVTAFEAVIVLALIGAFVGVAASYQRRVVVRVKELALKADLQCLRAGIVFFEATRGRRPAALAEVLAQPIGDAARGPQQRWGALGRLGQGMADPFGHSYRYDLTRGTVSSTTVGYEAW